MLQLLNDVPRREHEGGLIDVDEVVAYFAGMNLENRAVYLWLDAMLQSGLILNYDPTVQDIVQAKKVEISPAGRHHLFWATGNHEYLSAMADVTPLLNEVTFTAMQGARRPPQWRKKAVAFLDYMRSEDLMYCLIPNHDAYQSQVRLRNTFEGIARYLTEADIRRPRARASAVTAEIPNGSARVRNDV